MKKLRFNHQLAYHNQELLVCGLLILLLLIAYFPLAYAYYQFLRLASTVGFVFLAFKEWKHERFVTMIAFIGLAILFQPFEKIALGRAGWEVVNGIVIGILAIYVFYRVVEINSTQK